MTALEQFGLILRNTGRLLLNFVLDLDELVVLGANGVNELCQRRFRYLARWRPRPAVSLSDPPQRPSGP